MMGEETSDLLNDNGTGLTAIEGQNETEEGVQGGKEIHNRLTFISSRGNAAGLG